MKYSLRSIMWFVVVLCLTIAFVRNLYESRIAADQQKANSEYEPELREKMRAYRLELDKCLGKGWSLEKDDAGKLVVKRSRSSR